MLSCQGRGLQYRFDTMNSLLARVEREEALGPDEALAVLEAPSEELEGILAASTRVREKFFGNSYFILNILRLQGRK